MPETNDKKSWYKRWWAIVLFVFIGLIILGAIFGGNDSSNASFSKNSNPSSNTQQVQTTAYNIGDNIQAGDFKWKIIGVSTTSALGDSYFNKQADGIFVVLDLEVENTANSAQYLMDSNLKLIDNQGREFSSSTDSAS